MKERQRRLAAIDRDVSKLERQALAASSSIVRDIRRTANQALQQGKPVGPMIARLVDKLIEVNISGMVAAHMSGEVRTGLVYNRYAPKPKTASLLGLNNAIQFLQERSGLDAGQVRLLRERYSPVAVNSLNGITDQLRSRIDEAIANTVEAGGSVGDGMKALREAFDAAGISPDPAKAYRLESMYRTQSQIAYNAGRWQALQTPAIQEVLWGYEYNTVGDDRVRPSHAAMDGKKYPKDSPVWDTWTPPAGFGCRCTLLEIFVDEEVRQSAPPQDQPDPGFDFNPGKLFEAVVRLDTP